MKHFNSTTLQKEPKKVYAEVERGPVQIRRLGFDDMVLVSQEDFNKIYDVAMATRSKVAGTWDDIANNVSKK